MLINEKYFAELEYSDSAQAHFEYSPFGKIVLSNGPKAYDFSYRFSTKEFEPATTLILYQLRAYSPESGRWLSRDPIEERGGQNLYAMVSNNYINKWDILGKNDTDYDGISGECKCEDDDSESQRAGYRWWLFYFLNAI